MWQPQGFYNQYVLRTPSILTGEEAVRGLYNYSTARIAIIHGESFIDQKLFELTFAKKDICFIKRSWLDEPDINELEGTIKQLEKYKPDTIIAVGGGSVIDGTKLCRVFYEFPYFRIGKTRLDGETMRTRFIAIPTTVGSGAEVSSAAVYFEHNGHRKEMLVMHELQPDVVVYDARYVKNASVRLLCASALDAMAHILEGYVSIIDNELMDILAEKGLSILHGELKKIINDEDKSINYERLQYAGFIGGLVQNHCIVGAAHAIAHQLTGYGYSHGEAVSLILPTVIEHNMSDTVTAIKYQKIAISAGFENAEGMIDFIRKILICARIDERKESLKMLLAEVKNDSSFYDNVKEDKGGKGNPITITEEYVKQLIRSI